MNGRLLFWKGGVRLAISNRNNFTIENTAMQVIRIWGYDTKAFRVEYTRYRFLHLSKDLIGEDKYNAFRCMDNHIRLFDSDITTIIKYIREHAESEKDSSIT